MQAAEVLSTTRKRNQTKRKRSHKNAAELGAVGVVPAGFVLQAVWEYLNRAQSRHKNVQFFGGAETSLLCINSELSSV